MDVERRGAQASKAPRKVVFLDRNLTLTTQRERSTRCASYLYFCMDMTVEEEDQRADLHKCTKTILVISSRKQREEWISMAEARRTWRAAMRQSLDWLGMPDHRIPQSQFFFKPRPQKRPRRRWGDVVRKDLKEVRASEEEWYVDGGRCAE